MMTRPSRTDIQRRSPAQALMENARVIELYESRLWRRCGLVNLLQGISFDREFDLILANTELNAGSVLIDVGCGTGLYARGVAREHLPARIIGVDVSRPMLTHACTLCEREQVHVDFVEADAHHLPLADDVADAVMCCGALHLFQDPVAALAEMHRILKPAGHLAVAAYRRRSGSLSAYVAAIRRRLTGMAAFLPEELESTLRALNFCDIRTHHAQGIWLIASACKAP